MDELILKVLNYFEKYSSVGVLRALEDLYTLYKIEPEDGRKIINKLIEMGILERKGDIFSGSLNYIPKHGRKGDSGVVEEFEAHAVKGVVSCRKKIIEWGDRE